MRMPVTHDWAPRLAAMPAVGQEARAEGMGWEEGRGERQKDRKRGKRQN